MPLKPAVSFTNEKASVSEVSSKMISKFEIIIGKNNPLYSADRREIKHDIDPISLNVDLKADDQEALQDKPPVHDNEKQVVLSLRQLHLNNSQEFVLQGNNFLKNNKIKNSKQEQKEKLSNAKINL